MPVIPATLETEAGESKVEGQVGDLVRPCRKMKAAENIVHPGSVPFMSRRGHGGRGDAKERKGASLLDHVSPWDKNQLKLAHVLYTVSCLP